MLKGTRFEHERKNALDEMQKSYNRLYDAIMAYEKASGDSIFYEIIDRIDRSYESRKEDVEWSSDEYFEQKYIGVEII